MLKEYIRRLFICCLGLVTFALGNFFGVMSGSAGTNAWNTLALGISGFSGMSFGTATFAVSLAIILIDLFGRGKLGLGTFLNIIVISACSDIFLKILTFIPAASGPVMGLLYTLLGQTIISFSTILYMKPALGCGPRDTLMIIIGKKFPGAPIGTVKFALEMAALLAGIIMGAPFGIGTVLVMALQASIFQMACRICRYEPRSIVHEDVADTLRCLTEAFKKVK